jgi:hypothetical protein
VTDGKEEKKRQMGKKSVKKKRQWKGCGEKMRQIIKKSVERKNRGKTRLDETDEKQKCGEERQIGNKGVERRDR